MGKEGRGARLFHDHLPTGDARLMHAHLPTGDAPLTHAHLCMTKDGSDAHLWFVCLCPSPLKSTEPSTAPMGGELCMGPRFLSETGDVAQLLCMKLASLIGIRSVRRQLPEPVGTAARGVAIHPLATELASSSMAGRALLHGLRALLLMSPSRHIQQGQEKVQGRCV